MPLSLLMVQPYHTKTAVEREWLQIRYPGLHALAIQRQPQSTKHACPASFPHALGPNWQATDTYDVLLFLRHALNLEDMSTVLVS